VLKNSRDKALVVTAGITLQEALKAYEILKKKNIYIRVIDLYSLQPLDTASLIKNASECKNNVIAVEDHYCNALGSILSSVLHDVCQLCVRDIPRSGKAEELFKKYGIDASTIVKMVEQML
jgi:transketolase